MTSVKAIPDLQVEDFSKRFKKLVTSLVEIKHKKLKKDRPNVKNIVEAVNKQSDMMESKGDVESNGASVFDFDETLIIDGENFVVATIFLVVTAAVVCFPSICIWAIFGNSLRIFIKNTRAKKITEYILAILLVLTALVVLLK